jgi:hypothetical protein
MSDTVDKHRSNKSGIVNLNTANTVLREQPTPFMMNGEAFSKQIQP